MQEAISMTRRVTKSRLIQEALKYPTRVNRELNNRFLYQFLQYFFPLVSPHKFQPNWHIEYLCKELEALAYQVAGHKPRKYDLIINVRQALPKQLLVV